MKDSIEWLHDGAALIFEVPAGGVSEPYIAQGPSGPQIRHRMVERHTAWVGYVWNPLVSLWEPTGRDPDKDSCVATVGHVVAEIARRSGGRDPGPNPVVTAGVSVAEVSS